jgi:choline monooxygenase
LTTAIVREASPGLEIAMVVRTAPAKIYLDSARYERERQAVFARSWQFVGHESELSQTGDVITATLAGYPILVLRDGSTLRAFHNVCRHRAGPLIDGDRARCEGLLVCKYHGWSYALDGRLRAARDFGPAEGFDPRDYALFPLRLESWRGFIFVSQDRDAASLTTFVSPLEKRMGARDVGGLVHAGRKAHDIACNWKVYAENYLEGYHIPLVHAGLSVEVDASKYTVTVDGDAVFHHAPPRENAAVYDGLWCFLWPNLGINIYSHGLMMERMLPAGLSSTRLIYDFYLRPEIAAGPAERDRIIAMSATVTAEDKWICERVQANLTAGVYESGVLSPKHENGVAWFQAKLGTA